MTDKVKDSIERHGFWISLGSAVVVIIFIVSLVYSATTDRTQVFNRLAQCESSADTISRQVTALQARSNQRDVEMAEIKSELKNISRILEKIDRRIQ